MLSVFPTRSGGRRELLKGMDMFITLIVEMVSHLFTYIQAHQIRYFKLVGFLYINYTTIRLIKRKDMRVLDTKYM